MRLVMMILLLGAGYAFSESGPAEKEFPFFAYCIDTHDSRHRSLDEQAALIKELGYAGVGHLWLDNIPERLKTLDAAGLRLFQISIFVDLADEKNPFDKRVDEVFPLLKGRDVQICLLIKGFPPSDPQGDEKAAAIVRTLADKGAPFGVRIILYPHVDLWLEKVSDAVRLARKADRPNVGVMFNLCHWLKVDKEENLAAVIREASPYLWAVSINGADHAKAIRSGKGNWLQPLDRGDYDLLPLLTLLKASGYRGPVGLQCWGIEGDARDHLARSMKAWQGYMRRLDAPTEKH